MIILFQFNKQCKLQCLVISFFQDDLESLPFPNEETEFNLPDDIFDDVSNFKQQHPQSADPSVTSDEGV